MHQAEIPARLVFLLEDLYLLKNLERLVLVSVRRLVQLQLLRQLLLPGDQMDSALGLGRVGVQRTKGPFSRTATNEYTMGLE
jgi:hypothetical protein